MTAPTLAADAAGLRRVASRMIDGGEPMLGRELQGIARRMETRDQALSTAPDILSRVAAAVNGAQRGGWDDAKLILGDIYALRDAWAIARELVVALDAARTDEGVKDAPYHTYASKLERLRQLVGPRINAPDARAAGQ
jgi:hypothetical protein